LPFDEGAPTGESLRQIREIMMSAQDGARKVEGQVIPAEYREMVRRFQESLRRDDTGKGASNNALQGEAAEEK